ncbi:MAG: GFA family protein [Gammaproteobacteria bacterium]|nr:GFA family protein [Gammaproteobacteria bacterium]
MNIESKMEGGCLCGAIRYGVSGPPFATEYCHCGMCQKSAGAVAVCWMDFRLEQLTWTLGTPTEYKSSESVRRGFCANCGSTLSFRDTHHPEYITLAIASLDDPNLVEPTRHIYTESQPKWLNIDDDCVRFLQGPVKPSA